MPGRIRLATSDDAERVAAIYVPSVVNSAISFELEPPSPEEMRARIERILPNYPWLVCEDANGSVVGYVYAGRHAERAAYGWSTDVTAYIDASARRMGLGRALYTSLLDLLRLQGYANAYAGITLPNEASVGLHTAMGFKLFAVYEAVGYKLGAWHDVAYMALRLRPLDAAPKPPIPVSQLIGTQEWLAAIAKGESLLRS